MTADDGGAALHERDAAPRDRADDAPATRTSARRPRGGALDPRIGWALIAALTFVVLLTWAPSLPAGLGDNHEGRILGRHALHVTNAHEKGLAGSNWLSDASPYLESYAHHPPLFNVGYYLTDLTTPGADEVGLRLFAYLSGVAMIPVGSALLRRVGFGFGPVLLAAGAIAVTPLFWNFGRLHGNVTLLLAMLLVAVRLREDRDIGTREAVIGSTVSAIAVIAGYLGLATGALVGLWVLARRRLDRITVVLGAGLVLGAAVTAIYVVGNTGAEGVGAQVEMRTGGDFTREQFLERMARWREELLPLWWRQVLLPVAVLAGLLDRRTRGPVVITGLVALAYIYLLPQGSFVHDYWIFPLLLPVWFGTAALVAAVTEHAPRWLAAATAGAAAIALVVAGGLLLRGDVPDDYFREPEVAGDLVRDVGPPDQDTAWSLGIATPRWLSYYWDLPNVRLETDADLAEVPADELVLVRLDRIPAWFDDPDAVRDAAVELEGIYALVPGDELRDAVEARP